MTDWIKYVQWGVIGIAIMLMWTIASQPGPWGKGLVAVIVIIAAYMYWRREQSQKSMNPVSKRFQQLMEECHLNRAPGMGFLVMSGDKSHQGLRKGLITGGPLYRPAKDYLFKKESVPVKVQDAKGREIVATDNKGNVITEVIDVPRDKKDPRAEAFILSYTPQYGGMYDWPVIGHLMVLFGRKEYLFCVYKHQLVEQAMVGDVNVRGISTRYVGFMEYVNDFELDYDAEMLQLDKEVQRLTLIDHMTTLPRLVRNAVDSNSSHLRYLDGKDDIAGPR